MSEYLDEDQDELLKNRKRKRAPTPESQPKLPSQFQRPPIPITPWKFNVTGGELYADIPAPKPIVPGQEDTPKPDVS